jgi:hypothetical protein
MLGGRGATGGGTWMNPGDNGDTGVRPGGEQPPGCGPDRVSVTVRWERGGGGLRGQVIAGNTGGRAYRLPGKPAVRPRCYLFSSRFRLLGDAR